MRFKEVRQKNNTPLLAMCKDVGINRATLIRLEKGYVPPAIETLKTVAEYYGVTSDYIIGLDNNGQQEVREKITTEEFEERINKDKEYLKKFVSCIKTRLICEDM